MPEQKVVIDVGDGAAIPTKKDHGLLSAWRIAFFGAVLVLLYLVIVHPDPYWNLLKFIRDGVVFHQIYRGEATNEQLYQKLSDTLTMLRKGGEAK